MDYFRSKVLNEATAKQVRDVAKQEAEKFIESIGLKATVFEDEIDHQPAIKVYVNAKKYQIGSVRLTLAFNLKDLQVEGYEAVGLFTNSNKTSDVLQWLQNNVETALIKWFRKNEK